LLNIVSIALLSSVKSLVTPAGGLRLPDFQLLTLS
jgi:hypothetical protein